MDVVRHMIGEVLMGVISACGMGTLALSFVIGKVSLISINIIFGSMVVFIVHVFIGDQSILGPTPERGGDIACGIWIDPLGPTLERGGDVACGTWMDPHKQMRSFEGRQPGDQESGVRLRAGENRSCCACRDCSW